MIPTEMVRSAQHFFSPVNEIARASTEPRDWIFTFGAGHRAYVALRFSEDAILGKGFRLDDRYVVIRGTYDSARQRMVEIFGPVWCCQYGSPESAGVVEYALTELVITDVPS